jgi:glucokinase
MSVVRPPAWPMGEIVALDVGGTAVKCGVVQGASNAGWLPDVRHVARQPIDGAASAEAIADQLADIANGLLAQCRDPAFVVLAFPGPCDYARGIPRLAGLAKFGALYGVNLKTLIARRLSRDLPILFLNDAAAAALGEALARQLAVPALMLTLGTGLGSAFLDGMAVSTQPFPWSPTGEVFAEPALAARADDVFSIRGLDARLASLSVRCADLPALAAAGRVGGGLAAELARFGVDLGRWVRPYAAWADCRLVILGGGLGLLFDLFGPPFAAEAGIAAEPARLGDRAALVGGSFACLDMEGWAGSP